MGKDPLLCAAIVKIGMPVLALLHRCWNIMLLRAGPQDLPASVPLVKVMAVVLVVINAVFWAIAGEPFAIALITSLGYLALSMAFFALLLRQCGVLNRLPQTLMACFGTDTLFACIQLPITLGVTAETVSLWYALGMFVLLAWTLAVTTHIILQAVNVSKMTAVFLCLGYGLLTFGMVELIEKIIV